jgi:hypothetical protein
MTQNRWQIGALYNKGLQNGFPYWTQPGGIGSQVFPTQYSGPWVEYPIPGLEITEYIPWWSPACGHSNKFLKLIKEWDYDSNSDCCLVCCSLCTFVIRVIIPYDLALNPTLNAIIVA